MNNNDNLVKMVNQIGTFFESMPDRNEGLEGIATHLKKFWDPRMRKSLIAMIDANEHRGISEIVLIAVQTHREMLLTPA
ncbi:formate dehydrogenase subunit delta [Undibacterium sp.]|uniref:formate dehydrogenase subunit delta n=1 Tax=Undibacterium sp. TaxID=1914977 RepID=UPI003752D28A